MNLSYEMLQMQPFLLMCIIIAISTIVAVVGTWFFRKFIRINYRRSHNEMVGYVFAILGGFYGLLLGFVVFLVWDSMNSAQNNASQEGSLARGLYSDIRYYPDTALMKPLMASYMTYVRSVVNDEYPTMERLQPLTRLHRKYFNDVFYQLERLDPKDPRIEQMFRHLNELATFRTLRQTSGSSEIPIEIWIPLLVGGFIIMGIAMLVDVESLRLHVAINGLLGAFLGMVFFIIIILDHPFTGHIRIEPTEYESILQMHAE